MRFMTNTLPMLFSTMHVVVNIIELIFFHVIPFNFYTDIFDLIIDEIIYSIFLTAHLREYGLVIYGTRAQVQTLGSIWTQNNHTYFVLEN